jgi:hypothetical protein
VAKAKFARSEDFKTPPCRLSFAQNLFTARSQEEGKPKKFGCTLIFTNDQRAALEKKVAAVITEQWGEKGIERAKNGAIKSPFLSGTGKEARNKQTGELHPGMGEGVFFIRTQANEDRPPVIRYKSAHVPATQDEVYSGCRGFAVVNCFAWNHPTNGDGVSFGIQFFQKTQDDERIGGSGPIDVGKYFEKIDDEGDAPEETKDGAGASGLFG